MSNNKNELFVPYYVNQSRLMDIYAILNGGYSEYEEITVSQNEEKAHKAKAKLNGESGFKIFKIGADTEGNFSKSKNTQEGSTVKKVQTITSVLSIVLKQLKEKNYLKDILNSKEGSFVKIPVTLKINSINNALDEITSVLNLIKNMEKIGVSASINRSDIKMFDTISKTLKPLIQYDEVLFEDNEYALIGNISNNNLYQASQSDIIGTKLVCLAQIKKVFPNGTELMKNSTISKFKDKKLKNEFVKSLNEMLDNESYDFSSTVISSIEDKPVYEVEIIALYQTEI